MDMDSDEEDEDMMEARDSDEDEDLSMEYNNYLKLKLNREGIKRRLGDSMPFTLASMMGKNKKQKKQSILSEPQKENIH